MRAKSAKKMRTFFSLLQDERERERATNTPAASLNLLIFSRTRETDHSDVNCCIIACLFLSHFLFERQRRRRGTGTAGDLFNDPHFCYLLSHHMLLHDDGCLCKESGDQMGPIIRFISPAVVLVVAQLVSRLLMKTLPRKCLDK